MQPLTLLVHAGSTGAQIHDDCARLRARNLLDPKLTITRRVNVSRNLDDAEPFAVAQGASRNREHVDYIDDTQVALSRLQSHLFSYSPEPFAKGESPVPMEAAQTSVNSALSSQSTSQLPVSYSLAAISSTDLCSEGGKGVPGQCDDHDSSRVGVEHVEKASSAALDSMNGINDPAKGFCSSRRPLAICSGDDGPETLKRILPPKPPVALDQLDTALTPALRYLAESSEVSSVFKPISVARKLGRFERGYWLIDHKAWPPELFDGFWEFLQSMISAGSAGWGVWCTRERGLESGKQAQLSRRASLVKVYCWAEIIKHIYMLLYVASKARVRTSGLVWIDAMGVVVIRMKQD